MIGLFETMKGRGGAFSDRRTSDRIIVLPFRKSVEIAVKSIQARFFRSMITTVSLVLAVAFLSFTDSDLTILNSLLATGKPELRQAILRAGYDIQADASAVQKIGSSPKQRWILFLSFLACVVGIVNSQLMAVTERFREIGTMKCLGALDRFILRLFLLEAGIQGAIGAVMGAVIGIVASLANGVLRFGYPAWTGLNWLDIGQSLVVSTGFGCLMSLLGVLYPAWVAARMAPVEAMRVEN
ncbi:ABC transporter permease [Desulfatirhabdium butyrativorans]|uniref:ABC transporter permease n=1 Tax=Desulfatirhabdium butyrativorans TaxID=340467 RepID=UPI0004063301|nr:FtsX-like permease family protein [Desulfatirhabdium butyrativorans]